MYAAGLAVVLAFLMIGIGIWVGPKKTMLALAEFDRIFRRFFMGGDWTPIERFMVRKGWFMPPDADFKTPEDARRYAVSDSAIKSERFWIARIWGGLAIILSGFTLVILIAVPFQ